MSETEQSTGGADQVQASGQEQVQQQQDKVAYETYRKTVDAEKKAKAKADELARKVKEFEEKEMAAQGKSQELIESLRTQVKEREAKLENVVGTFAQRAVENSIKAEASKYGCLDVDLLLKAGAEEFGTIEVDVEKGFSVNPDDTKRFFENMNKKHPMMFKQSGPKFHDATPGAQPGKKFSADELKKLNGNQLKELLAMKLGKK